MFGLRTLSRWYRRRRVEWTRPKLALSVTHFGSDGETGHWSLFVLFAWVRLWDASVPLRDPDGMLDAYGVHIDVTGERYVYLEWGNWHKFVALPWQYDWVSTERMNRYGAFVRCEWSHKRSHASQVLNDPMEGQSFPFRYRTASGEVQETVVTVRAVERRTWQWVIFKRLGLPLARRRRASLSLHFADEMGSERGSWKGGVVGCGCGYVPGESVEQAVRRFENLANLTHRFCR